MRAARPSWPFELRENRSRGPHRRLVRGLREGEEVRLVEHRDDGVVHHDATRAIVVMGVRQPHPGFDLDPVIDGAMGEASRDEWEETRCLRKGRWLFAYPEMLIVPALVAECADVVQDASKGV